MIFSLAQPVVWDCLIVGFLLLFIIMFSCHRFSFFPGTSLEPVVNPTTQASSLRL
jgi:hypothetical protein